MIVQRTRKFPAIFYDEVNVFVSTIWIIEKRRRRPIPLQIPASGLAPQDRPVEYGVGGVPVSKDAVIPRHSPVFYGVLITVSTPVADMFREAVFPPAAPVFVAGTDARSRERTRHSRTARPLP